MVEQIQNEIQKLLRTLDDFEKSGVCSTFRAEVRIDIEEKISELEKLLRNGYNE